MKEKSSVNDWYRFAEMYGNTAGFLLDNRKPPYDVVCYLSGCPPNAP